ncbi:hypothetical protein M885DRAFT_614437 [Pelagophyceae sp. CCMP2097]|nr:hypothetical protein M885DRAFT_614437 [Pelagophyceae sp. CCMP2097]
MISPPRGRHGGSMYSPKRSSPRLGLAATALVAAPARRGLADVFEMYCRWGSGSVAPNREARLNSHNFMKMMRDARLVTRQLTPIVLDLVFSRHTARGHERTISFETFEDVLVECATRGKVDMAAVFATISRLSAPMATSQLSESMTSSLKASTADAAKPGDAADGALFRLLGDALGELSQVALGFGDDVAKKRLAARLRAVARDFDRIAARLDPIPDPLRDLDSVANLDEPTPPPVETDLDEPPPPPPAIDPPPSPVVVPETSIDL